MKKLIHLLLLTGIVTTLFTFSSCKKESSDTVAQDKIWTSYTLYYDKNKDKTFARATFKFSNILGTNLELKSPAVVKFNGDVLTFQPLLAYYEKEYAGFISSGSFNYTDLDGHSFTNLISGIKPIAFPSIGTIHTANSYTLTWTGDPIGANEKVTLWLDGINQNNSELFYQNNINSQNIICAANQLQQLGNGPGTGWMERIISPAVQSVTSAGGEIKGVYKALDLSTQIAN